MIRLSLIKSILLSIIILIILIVLISNKNSCSDIEKNNFLDKGLVLYFKFDDSFYKDNYRLICDLSGNENHGKLKGSNNLIQRHFEFNGLNSLIVEDDRDLSPGKKGFTISFFVQFNNTNFSRDNSSYINFLGKGNPNEGYEYSFREYNSSNFEQRDDRLSFYVFNPEGGLGSGSYVQEKINLGEWIYLTGVIEGDKVKIYKNGILKGSNEIAEYNVSIKNTKSNFYISNLNGSIEELRIYNRALSEKEISEIYSYGLKRL